MARIPLLALAALFVSLFSIPQISAQAQCGVAQSITYPIDTSTFHLVQDFAVPSSRHQGRYHTGEDWYAGREVSNFGLGMPVRAAADGRVTYSSTIGWGRDGGVVIIEHTFPDGSIAYSQYGHMEETDNAHFPAQWSCIKQGDIVGAIGNIRPAPHIHFEIRVSDGTSPGPGYSWENPIRESWRKPAKFVQNWQAWFQDAYLWRLDLADEAGPVTPPLVLEDRSLLYLDANRVGRVSPDGRVLWRINLERPAVALTMAADERPLIAYADGEMQRVNLDGSLGERWSTNTALDSAPMLDGAEALFHTPDDALVALGADRQQVAWTLEDVPSVARSQFAGDIIGLITTDHQMLTLTASGQPIDRAQLREMGALADGTQGNLLALTFGGLWTITPDGIWDVVIEDIAAENESAALAHTAEGELYAFDGHVLHAYDAARNLRWQVEIPQVSGMAALDVNADTLLLTTNYGDIIAIQASSGGLCGRTQIYGSERAHFWHYLGEDGVLRVAVSDQILGLDWARFLGGCAA